MKYHIIDKYAIINTSFGKTIMIWKKVKDDKTLWMEVSQNLSELSHRDKVKYRVAATSESVQKKLDYLNKEI